MRLLVVLVLCVGCVDGVMDSDDRIDDRVDDRVGRVVGSLQIPEGFAACSAITELAAQSAATLDGRCGVTVEVHVECAPSAQLHSWIRLGVLADGELWAHEDTRYSCGDEVARVFTVPCDAFSIIGGATFDHPETATDVSCQSEPI